MGLSAISKERKDLNDDNVPTFCARLTKNGPKSVEKKRENQKHDTIDLYEQLLISERRQIDEEDKDERRQLNDKKG